MDADIETIVLGRFQRYAGSSDELPAGSRLLEDLGIDSIAFVAILMDLADELELDLGIARVSLGKIQTLDDVVSIVRSLRDAEPVTD